MSFSLVLITYRDTIKYILVLSEILFAYEMKAGNLSPLKFVNDCIQSSGVEKCFKTFK